MENTEFKLVYQTLRGIEANETELETTVNRRGLKFQCRLHTSQWDGIFIIPY